MSTVSQDHILRRIADTDDVQGLDWNELRQAIRDKVELNVKLFTDPASSPPTPFDVTPSTQGGLRLAPFPPKKLSQLHMYDPPLSYMNPEQVKDAVQAIFDQLDVFEGPPFTIQRLCELLLEPKRQYKSVGKYLRAVEKSILVTSTYDSFPQDASPTNGHPAAPTPQPLVFTSRSRPSTPLFSPIAFLHEDARTARSRSRSISPARLDDTVSVREATQPPPSPPPDSEPGTPLLLIAELPSKPDEKNAIKQDDVGEASVGIGLVDELDDPSPGHMSDSPTPLTAIAAGGKAKGKPILGSLKDRFVKSGTETEGSSSEEKVTKKPKVDDTMTGEDHVKKEDEDNKMQLDSSEEKP